MFAIEKYSHHPQRTAVWYLVFYQKCTCTCIYMYSPDLYMYMYIYVFSRFGVEK